MLERKRKKSYRFLKVLLIIVMVVVVLFSGAIMTLQQLAKTMDPTIASQLWSTLEYVPSSLLKYQFMPKSNEKVNSSLLKAEGFIKGICHPSRNYDLVKEANIEWDRADIPFPFDEKGEIRESYINWRAGIQEYVDNGIKILAVTPYPGDFYEFGIDPRLPESESKIKGVAIFLIQDLKGIISGIQISNELGVARFLYPLESMEQAVWFMGIQLEAIAPFKGDIIAGYNSAGPQADHHAAMKPYHKYCDYIGVDIYAGCFASAGVPFMNNIIIFDLIPQFLYAFTGLPVIICEFGYISEGEPKSAAEKLAILQEYGYNSEEEAKANITEFIAQLPENFQNDIKKGGGSDPGAYIFSDLNVGHLYRELPEGVVLKDYPHTPEGQAGFYEYIIPHLASYPFIIGTFVYCWKDSDRCYVCGFEDCPIETRWGLVTRDEEKKPSFYAVKNAFAIL
ncbi:MAG: hypothetical protein LBF12_02600 [Christensenellaceae bacterium]|jgi:hypothetical protein|nr:hypothetical protein [Christensenellaceae bacterium]